MLSPFKVTECILISGWEISSRSTKKGQNNIQQFVPSFPFILKIFDEYALREKCPYSELFWFECRKTRTRITPNTDTFYAVMTTSQERHHVNFFAGRGGEGGYVNLGPFILDNVRTFVKALQNKVAESW